MTKRKGGPSAEVRIRVLKRDRFTCVYCGKTGAESELEIDHIHPVSKGGSHHVSNLVTACRTCNQAKGAGTLERKATENSPSKSYPIGLFVHTLKDGLARYQGRIIGVDGDTFFVQLFSALNGDPTNVEVFPKAFIYGPECRLYADHARWGEDYIRDCRTQFSRGAGKSA
jgi:hypothetical protein